MEAQTEMVARIFQTLADANRLRIISVLTMDCQSVSAIVAATGLSQPLVSHHLRVLREQGLARSGRRGTFTYYWLSEPAVREIVERCSALASRLREGGEGDDM